MNRSPLLFLGLFFALASSFWGLVLMPQLQIGRQAPRPLEAPGQFYPSARPGLAKAGAEVYRSLGCVECHTQQVHGDNRDVARGWGTRISVAQDYLQDEPVLLGRLRLGPDLTNIGARKPDLTWHLLHLRNPRLNVPGSLMPRYPFLFEMRKVHPGQRSTAGALPARELKEAKEVKDDEEIIPRPAAQALVAYLVSLRSEVPLFEAPIPTPATNAPPAVAADTNAAAANIPLTNAPLTNAPLTNAATNLPAPAPAP